VCSGLIPWRARSNVFVSSRELLAHDGLEPLLQLRYQLFVGRVDFGIGERPLRVAVT
jgi:hypothetical protein